MEFRADFDVMRGHTHHEPVAGRVVFNLVSAVIVGVDRGLTAIINGDVAWVSTDLAQEILGEFVPGRVSQYPSAVWIFCVGIPYAPGEIAREIILGRIIGDTNEVVSRFLHT